MSKVKLVFEEFRQGPEMEVFVNGDDDVVFLIYMSHERDIDNAGYIALDKVSVKRLITELQAILKEIEF